MDCTSDANARVVCEDATKKPKSDDITEHCHQLQFFRRLRSSHESETSLQPKAHLARFF